MKKVRKGFALVCTLGLLWGVNPALTQLTLAADHKNSTSNLGLSDEFFQSGQYFRAARYAFAAQLENSSSEPARPSQA